MQPVSVSYHTLEVSNLQTRRECTMPHGQYFSFPVIVVMFLIVYPMPRSLTLAYEGDMEQ